MWTLCRILLEGNMLRELAVVLVSLLAVPFLLTLVERIRHRRREAKLSIEQH
jgi:hypothetical protein